MKKIKNTINLNGNIMRLKTIIHIHYYNNPKLLKKLKNKLIITIILQSHKQKHNKKMKKYQKNIRF